MSETKTIPGITPQKNAAGALICGVPGCENKHLARGYCAMHRKRLDRGIPLDAPVAQHTRGGAICSTPGCHNPTIARYGKYQKRGSHGQCRDCYRRAVRAEERREREVAQQREVVFA